MHTRTVLVVGGSGHFGRLLIDDLRRYTDCDLISPERHIADLWNRPSLERALAGVSIAICAAGPFQQLPTALAELCISHGVHYIDFADDRDFVRRVRALAFPGVSGRAPAICCGWSTVSALSGALVHIGQEGLDEVDSIYIHMAPGNRLPRGIGTIASLLHSLGHSFELCRDGQWQTVTGWSEPRHFRFPDPIGIRVGYLVDVPDHELFPKIFGARTVEFRAGSELTGLNVGAASLAYLVKKGIVGSWAHSSKMLQYIVALSGFMGHDWGSVGVEVAGSSGGRRLIRSVSILARSGGQRIAVMPASIMTGFLLSGSGHSGLVSPTQWLTYESLQDACAKRGFELSIEEHE